MVLEVLSCVLSDVLANVSDVTGMLLKFSALCSSDEVGSLESLYRRRSTKPLVTEVPESYNPATAPDNLNMIKDHENMIPHHLTMIPHHLNMIPEDPSDKGVKDARIPLSVLRQESCPELVRQLQDKTRKIRKIQSMGS